MCMRKTDSLVTVLCATVTMTVRPAPRSQKPLAPLKTTEQWTCSRSQRIFPTGAYLGPMPI